MSHATRRSLSLPISYKNNIQRRLSDNGMYKYWYESQMITDTLVYLMILRRNYISNMFHIGLHDIKILGQKINSLVQDSLLMFGRVQWAVQKNILF